MKTKMKKLISIGSVSMLTLVLLIVLGSALASGRKPLSVSGEVTAISQTQFQGTATLSIEGEEFEGLVTVSVDPEQIEVRNEVTHYKCVMHVFEFSEEDTLITIGEEFAAPADDNPGILTLHGNMEITEGTGVFEGGSGELRVNGQMNVGVMPPEATFEANGIISR